ncbi:MAG: hypothetical protein ABR915_12535 [Thermoguttaceae bacterium]|jgi:hypothetical protein
MLDAMEASHQIDVTNLDSEHRRAFEDIIGTRLQANQRLVISVTEVDVKAPAPTPRRAQSIRDWTSVYEGLTDEEVDAINT